MNLAQKDFCICTYVAGNTYRSLAKNLIGDLAKYAPEIPFMIYTDKPEEFQKYNNVLVFGHKRKGVLYYHERRFAIQKALSMFKSCMYIDSDVRICAPIPQREWLPGITARSCTNMIKHFQERINKTNPPSVSAVKKFEFFQKMAKKLDVDLETEKVTWINEFLFVVTRDSGKETEFLKNWEKIALYAEVNGLHKHPAYAMGLAATKANFEVRHDVMEGVDFFDDRVEKIRISKGQASSKDKLEYFAAQNKIENPHDSILKKIIKKANKYIEYLYHSMRLKVTAMLSDYNFYYR
ncbi:hypothetical protein IQ247_22770 [Plectonema cf. radiosum LEGE 06105]|uniref:Uncharacterized protein n=1 Tax=Plectonema cf. radiosum LEGE 06105 TaxID=945769 RepID=A0A8J7K3N8_9CYAN|nr:hypothetical protein [Plectonema radiosum]MBE9215452.1 hypothetical protein [Plectonema cf. radiosum LEGE 06105]